MCWIITQNKGIILNTEDKPIQSAVVKKYHLSCAPVTERFLSFTAHHTILHGMCTQKSTEDCTGNLICGVFQIFFSLGVAISFCFLFFDLILTGQKKANKQPTTKPQQTCLISQYLVVLNISLHTGASRNACFHFQLLKHIALSLLY